MIVYISVYKPCPQRKLDEKKFLILKKKILRKIFWLIKDVTSGERKRRENAKLEAIFLSTYM